MSNNFKLVDRETECLFPPSVQHYLPEDHLARIIVDIVDQLDLRTNGRLSRKREESVLPRQH